MKKKKVWVMITCERSYPPERPYRVSVHRNGRTWRRYHTTGHRVEQILNLLDYSITASTDHFIVDGYYPKAGK